MDDSTTPSLVLSRFEWTGAKFVSPEKKDPTDICDRIQEEQDKHSFHFLSTFFFVSASSVNAKLRKPEQLWKQ